MADQEDEEIEASEELIELTRQALEQGVESVRAGGPLVPFALTQSGQGRNLTRFVTPTLEESIKAARHHLTVKAAETRRYAVAFDGYVTVDGEKFDAIIVECGERGHAEGHLFAQRYRPAEGGQSLAVVGAAAYLGRSPNLIGASA